MIPNIKMLENAYDYIFSLESKNADLNLTDLKRLATYSQWPRIDPRIGEILVHFLSRRWNNINAVKFNAFLLGLPWPQVVGVLLEQTTVLVTKEKKNQFVNWKKSVLTDIEPVPSQLFFIGTQAFAGKQVEMDATRPLKSFVKWGYFGRSLFHKKGLASTSLTQVLPKTRKKILSAFLKTHLRITVKQYRNLFDNLISPRQAQRDLAQHKGLKKMGNTKGAVFICSK